MRKRKIIYTVLMAAAIFFSGLFYYTTRHSAAGFDEDGSGNNGPMIRKDVSAGYNFLPSVVIF